VRLIKDMEWGIVEEPPRCAVVIGIHDEVVDSFMNGLLVNSYDVTLSSSCPSWLLAELNSEPKDSNDVLYEIDDIEWL
jgi:hypothetical protein